MLQTTRIIINYFMSSIKKHIILFVSLISISIISKVLLLIPPFINGKIIDNVILLKFNEIINLILLSFFILLSDGILSLLQTYINVYLSNVTLAELKEKLCKKILYLRMSEFNKRTPGEYLSRLEGDTNTISTFYINTIPNLVLSMITMFVTGFFSFYLSPVLSFVGIIGFPISLIINYFFGKKMKVCYTKVRKATDEYTEISQQMINSERAIKGLHAERPIWDHFMLKLNLLFKLNIKSGMISAYGGLLQMISSTILELLLMSLACYLIIKGNLSIGSYVAFNVYLSQFLSSLRTIASTNLNIQTVLVSMKRVDEIIDTDKEEYMDDTIFTISQGNVEIDNLEFSYNENSKVINKLSVKFYSSTITAIVGLSGCGKTTLLNLILRIYEFTGGNIFIDNQNIKDFTLHDIRTFISYVQQEPFFLIDTIRNNLTLVNPTATNEEIIEACKKAYIYETIVSLPYGFDTVIGGQGSNLSGGQKQRLAIARGILKKSKIFLLDEITSNLDGETEKYILKTLLSLSKDYTIIIVAHRLTTVENIPRIVVIDNGKNIAEGSHEQLISTCEIYKKLFQNLQEV